MVHNVPRREIDNGRLSGSRVAALAASYARRDSVAVGGESVNKAARTLQNRLVGRLDVLDRGRIIRYTVTDRTKVLDVSEDLITGGIRVERSKTLMLDVLQPVGVAGSRRTGNPSGRATLADGGGCPRHRRHEEGEKAKGPHGGWTMSARQRL